MAHDTDVSTAIKEVLKDIDGLATLVAAVKGRNPDANEVYKALKEVVPTTPPFTPDQKEEFCHSLKYGVVTLTAESLVDYYQELSSKRIEKGKMTRVGDRAKAPPQEWTP